MEEIICEQNWVFINLLTIVAQRHLSFTYLVEKSNRYIYLFPLEKSCMDELNTEL